MGRTYRGAASDRREAQQPLHLADVQVRVSVCVCVSAQSCSCTSIQHAWLCALIEGKWRLCASLLLLLLLRLLRLARLMSLVHTGAARSRMKTTSTHFPRLDGCDFTNSSVSERWPLLIQRDAWQAIHPRPAFVRPSTYDRLATDLRPTYDPLMTHLRPTYDRLTTVGASSLSTYLQETASGLPVVVHAPGAENGIFF